MDKNLILYGAGEYGTRWIEKIGADRVWKFADSDLDKIGKTICGKEIVSLEQLYAHKENIKIYISVSEKYRKDIEKLLLKSEMGGVVISSPYPQEVVRVEKGARFNVNTYFEGRNYIGENSLIEDSVIGYDSYLSKATIFQNVRIGRYSAIGSGVSVIRGQHPTKKFVSIHPSFYSPENAGSSICYVSKNLYEEYKFTEEGYVVDIGNDVWIGNNVQLMEGISVGNGAIVAAGAIVTKDVQPYTVVGGVPAKWIKDRFSEKQKEFLNRLQWWNKPEDWIKKNARYFSDIEILQKHIQEA